MKLLLGFIIGILVLTAVGSGYFIWDLIGQIENLETDLEQSLVTLSSEIEKTAGTTRTLLEESDAANKALIEETNESLALYSSSTSEQFSSIESDLNKHTGSINNLTARTGSLETIAADSTLQAQDLYERSKKAIVRITDGEMLVGSGFLFNNPDGGTSEKQCKIVTAYHVVEDLDNIHISLYDGRTWKGMIWAYSKEADIAILNFSADTTSQLPTDLHTMPTLTTADSTGVKPGDPAFIVGSPGDSEKTRLGLKDTINTGVISYVNRCITIQDDFLTNLLQFDAAANPGNSGSPLLNREGKVIGVVIAGIRADLGQGISYAVTSNMINKVASSIVYMQSGTFTYELPWTGITARDLLPKDIVTNNNTVVTGAKVTAVSWPASTAGVQVDDVIVMIDDRMIRDSDEFYSVLAEYYEIGDTVILEIKRDGQPVSVNLTIGEKP